MTKKYGGVRFLEENGRIYMRIYARHDYIDIDLDVLDLGLIIKDAAAIHAHAVARALSKDAAA